MVVEMGKLIEIISAIKNGNYGGLYSTNPDDIFNESELLEDLEKLVEVDNG